MDDVVILVKPRQTSRLGLRLAGAPPRVVALTAGAIAAESRSLEEGDMLLAVNVAVTAHEQATELLKQAVGRVALRIRRDGVGATSSHALTFAALRGECDRSAGSPDLVAELFLHCLLYTSPSPRDRG